MSFSQVLISFRVLLFKEQERHGTYCRGDYDSQKFTDFLDDTDETVYADSAYAGQDVPKQIRAEICEKG